MKERNDRGGAHSGKTAKVPRQQRLKRALRDNLKRRKSQAKERGHFTEPSSGRDEVTRMITGRARLNSRLAILKQAGNILEAIGLRCGRLEKWRKRPSWEPR